MTNKLTKYGIMIIATVLLVAMAFAGAASAIPITANEWNNLTTSEQINGNVSYEFNDNDGCVIYPKFNGSSSVYYEPTHDITFDFTNYHGAFAGVPSSTGDCHGSLFGNIQNASAPILLTINNLVLDSVRIDSSEGGNLGGIVGRFYGVNKTLSKIILTNCTVQNCIINGTLWQLGGLVGCPDCVEVVAQNCRVIHCDIVSTGGLYGMSMVGGLAGGPNAVNFTDCEVANCTITGRYNSVGGLLGVTYYSNLTNCTVKNTVVYGSGSSDQYVAGLAGYVNDNHKLGARSVVRNCTVINCVIATPGKNYGGLTGLVQRTSIRFYNCTVMNSTMIGGGTGAGGLCGWGGGSGLNNSLESSAIYGGPSDINTKYVIGTDADGGSRANCVISGDCFLNNDTQHDTITTSAALDADFWHTISYTQAENISAGLPLRTVTYLGTHGTVDGYGAVDHMVSYDGNGNTGGSAPSSMICPVGLFLTVADAGDLEKTGSSFNGWYNESTGLVYPGNVIAMTENLSFFAVWTENQTTVKYHNISTEENVSVIYAYNETAVLPTEPVRLGYWFNGWNLSSPSGYPFSGNTSYFSNEGTWIYLGPNGGTLDVYANWTGNPYTVSFNANGGAGSMAPQDFVYGEAPKKLSSNTFTRAGFSFAGWSTSPNGGVIYTDGQSVQNIAYGGTLPLYAVWTDKEFTITVYLDTINGTAPYAVKLMRGNETIKENLSVPSNICEFTAIPKGTYDIVAEDSGAFKKIVTSIVTIATQDEDVYITFPVNNVSSEVIVSNADNTPAVVVGGLDKEAEANAVSSHNVTMTLTVQAKDELSGDTNATIAIAAIKDNTTDSVVKEDMQFLDINVNKTVDTVTYSVNETTELIEIVVPYDFTGKDQIKVSRYHEGSYQSLTEIFSVADKADGTFRLDRTNGMIYIYAKKFSMYSIGYTATTPAPQYTPSSSSQSGSTIILPEGQTAPTQAPTAAPTTVPTDKPVTPTVVPTANPTTTPQTPVPFVGLVLGLGVAAVLLRLRK